VKEGKIDFYIVHLTFAFVVLRAFYFMGWLALKSNIWFRLKNIFKN
jgi:hypothetical protein